MGRQKRYATAAARQAAYRRRALEAHPDKQGGSVEAFQRLGEAHAVISDPARRAAHDADVRDWVRMWGARAAAAAGSAGGGARRR